jgi:hypothetical protein
MWDKVESNWWYGYPRPSEMKSDTLGGKPPSMRVSTILAVSTGLFT